MSPPPPTRGRCLRPPRAASPHLCARRPRRPSRTERALPLAELSEGAGLSPPAYIKGAGDAACLFLLSLRSRGEAGPGRGGTGTGTRTGAGTGTRPAGGGTGAGAAAAAGPRPRPMERRRGGCVGGKPAGRALRMRKGRKTRLIGGGRPHARAERGGTVQHVSWGGCQPMV